MALFPASSEGLGGEINYESVIVSSGITGNIKAAKAGNVVTIIFEITAGLTANTFKTVTTNLPQEYRPSMALYAPLAHSKSNATPAFGACLAYINTSGTIDVESIGTTAYGIATYIV